MITRTSRAMLLALFLALPVLLTGCGFGGPFIEGILGAGGLGGGFGGPVDAGFAPGSGG